MPDTTVETSAGTMSVASNAADPGSFQCWGINVTDGLDFILGFV